MPRRLHLCPKQSATESTKHHRNEPTVKFAFELLQQNSHDSRTISRIYRQSSRGTSVGGRTQLHDFPGNPTSARRRQRVSTLAIVECREFGAEGPRLPLATRLRRNKLATGKDPEAKHVL